MKHFLYLLLISISTFVNAANDGERTVVNLNGIWQFDQTVTAFPPVTFTRTIPVPGLVHLAEPKEGNIKDLKPTITLDWLQHAFAPVSTFINLTDVRYTKILEPHKPMSTLLINLAGVNNLTKTVSGNVKVKLINKDGKIVSEQSFSVELESFQRTSIPVSLILPPDAGGYVLIAEFTPENGKTVISRRFLKVGQSEKYNYFTINPHKLSF